jgi:hypothetical protein
VEVEGADRLVSRTALAHGPEAAEGEGDDEFDALATARLLLRKYPRLPVGGSSACHPRARDAVRQRGDGGGREVETADRPHEVDQVGVRAVAGLLLFLLLLLLLLLLLMLHLFGLWCWSLCLCLYALPKVLFIPKTHRAIGFFRSFFFWVFLLASLP